ncbi:MAG: YhbY family RNA-binding protein, partial [Clostridia bacterium]|nr:YhbY family RNA-binding protein [Clostridia bacterium]
MTSKQRSNLKSIAATMKPIAQVGKEGIGENLIKSLSEALEAHEMIKVNLLPASGEDGDNLAMNIADLLHAEVVAGIGRK